MPIAQQKWEFQQQESHAASESKEGEPKTSQVVELAPEDNRIRNVAIQQTTTIYLLEPSIRPQMLPSTPPALNHDVAEGLVLDVIDSDNSFMILQDSEDLEMVLGLVSSIWVSSGLQIDIVVGHFRLACRWSKALLFEGFSLCFGAAKCLVPRRVPSQKFCSGLWSCY
ncbi:hypothetical protein Nepgr_006593 [Nepenthes gracilis]|uniref:Uncharacterized protein n=1 Tax=Nepenthes gracilis TaxID=150966 RepID=A0AAD3XHI4_NEPGR|nr:hypothetical protein Nepgr_006593 [Nepenthes gracilis]